MISAPENSWLRVYTRKFHYPKPWNKGMIQRSLLAWAGHCCEDCGATDEEALLHVHHLLWKAKHDCRWENLAVLCVSCHTRIHNRKWQPGILWQERWGAFPAYLRCRGHTPELLPA